MTQEIRRFNIEVLSTDTDEDILRKFNEAKNIQNGIMVEVDETMSDEEVLVCVDAIRHQISVDTQG